MWGDIFKAITLGAILPMFGGGKDTQGTSWGKAGMGTSSSSDGLMSKIFGIGGDMFSDLMIGKLTDKGKASQRISSYLPDLGGAYLDTDAMKGAGGVDKLHAVNPKDNDRAMEMLLTKMLTSPVYSERIGS